MSPADAPRVRCPDCGMTWSAALARIGERCGVRVSAAQWCDGKLAADRPAPAWLDAPDSDGWWWMRDLDGRDYIVNLYSSAEGLRTIHGSLPSHMPGRQWQRVAAPREDV